MATNTLIAVGATAANSSDFTVAVGAELDLYLTTASGVEAIPATAVVLVQKKSGSNYTTMFTLTKANPSAKLKGAGTWRGKRGDSDTSYGLDSET